MAPTARNPLARFHAGRREALRGLATKVLDRQGYATVRKSDEHPIPSDFDERARELIAAVRPYTLTTPERIIALRESIRYLHSAGIEGAIAECGVWRGGSAMVIARTLVELGATDREIYLYDTFSETPPPDERDRHLLRGPCGDYYDPEGIRDDPVFSYLPFERVRELVLGTGYPPERVHFVKGLVEETIPEHAPVVLALCRLDTDWYRSTRHEMEHLFPRIAPGGVLILDDYGEFLGARQAVDEYLAIDGRSVLLSRIDVSCRIAIVPASGQPAPG